MTIDDRLREAARDARAAIGGLEVPAASRARRVARWRGPLSALAAAAVVVGVVAGVALLRSAGSSPATVAPAGPEPTTASPEPTDDVSQVIPEGAVLVPIDAGRAADVGAARRAAEDAEGVSVETIGAVGGTVMFTSDHGVGEQCLVAVDVPQVRSSCGPGGPGLGYSIRQLPDGTHQAVVSGRLPADAEVLLVTAGDTRYAQQARDGWVFVPFDPEVVPVRVEAYTGDGRRVASNLAVDGRRAERVQALLQLRVTEALAELRRNPDPIEQAVLDAQVKRLETPIVQESEAESFAALLALGERRLDEVRRAIEDPVAPPAESPQVIPTEPEVTAALGDTVGIAAPPQPGTVWLAGSLRVVDGVELPSRLFQVDAATGRIVVAHDVGPPMHHLAAGVGRVWFGRTGDGALPQSAVGYVDLALGEIDIVETDRAIADVVLADDGGGRAWVIGGEPGAPLVARVGPDAVPAPLALDFEPALLRTGLAWEGGLLVADDAGTLWRVDASTETVDRFAELGGAPFALGAASLPGGEPAAWALAWADPEVRAVLLDGAGEPVAEHVLPRDTRSLANEPGSGAFALTTGGEVWFFDAGQAPVLVATVDPGSADTGFDGMVRSGTALWLRGGTAGVVRLELGQ